MGTFRWLWTWWPLGAVLVALAVLNFDARPRRRFHGISVPGVSNLTYHYGWPERVRVPPNQPQPWGRDEFGAWLINAVIAGVTLATTASVVWMWPASERRLRIRHLLLLQVIAALCWMASPPMPRVSSVHNAVQWFCFWTVLAPYPLALYAALVGMRTTQPEMERNGQKR
jgi:H+/Cl- antiporter ClcA